MYCMSCGGQLPPEAAFCFRCGAPQNARASSPEPVTRSEKRDITLVAVICPVCGGPIKDESRCGFCGSVVVITMDMPRIDPGSLKRAVIDQHIAEYRAAVRRDQNDETAHYGLGIAYYNLRLHEEAIAEIEEAVRLMPENPHIQFQLAVMYSEFMPPRQFGQQSNHHGMAALKRVDRSLTIRPQMVEALLLKAALYSHPRYCDFTSLCFGDVVNDFTKAIAYWEMAHAVDPDSIRQPVAEFLSQPSVPHKNPRLPDIELGKAILRTAPQFQVKKGMFGADRSKLAQAEAEIQQFYSGAVDDSSRLLSASRYVVDVMHSRIAWYP